MGRKKAGRAFAFPALAAALCLLSGGMACGGSGLGPRAVEQRTVKIAVVDLFSGPPAAATGPDVQNSLQVAVDGLNARGGLLGQHVEIVAADGERNAAKVAELVRQQLSDDDVKLLVGPASTATFLPVK